MEAETSSEEMTQFHLSAVHSGAGSDVRAVCAMGAGKLAAGGRDGCIRIYATYPSGGQVCSRCCPRLLLTDWTGHPLGGARDHREQLRPITFDPSQRTSRLRSAQRRTVRVDTAGGNGRTEPMACGTHGRTEAADRGDILPSPQAPLFYLHSAPPAYASSVAVSSAGHR